MRSSGDGIAFLKAFAMSVINGKRREVDASGDSGQCVCNSGPPSHHLPTQNLLEDTDGLLGPSPLKAEGLLYTYVLMGDEATHQ